jgi:hypothetical protein
VEETIEVECSTGVIKIRYRAGQELEMPDFENAYEIEIQENAKKATCELHLSDDEMEKVLREMRVGGRPLKVGDGHPQEESPGTLDPPGHVFAADVQSLRYDLKGAGPVGLAIRDMRKRLGLSNNDRDRNYLQKLMKELDVERRGKRHTTYYRLPADEESETKVDVTEQTEPRPQLPQPDMHTGGSPVKKEDIFLDEVGGDDLWRQTQLVRKKRIVYDTKKSGTVDNTIDGRYDSRIVTVDILTAAIQESIKVGEHHMDEGAAKEMAKHVLGFFGYNDRILDNVLEPEDRDAFYMLEETEMLKTDREETTLYDGREWRIHYWVLMKDTIYGFAKQEEDSSKVPEDPAAVYSNTEEVPEDAWRR